jgi:parallel beta-helix repeat protein
VKNIKSLQILGCSTIIILLCFGIANIQSQESIPINRGAHDISVSSYHEKTVNIDATQYTEHDAIRIQDDDDFHSQAMEEGWDLGGERDGNSTTPYLISGYHFKSNIPKLIEIRNTQVHFDISDNIFEGDPAIYQFGIDCHYVQNGLITGNTIYHLALGISMYSMDQFDISENTLYNISNVGILLNRATFTTVTNNSIDTGGMHLIGLSNSLIMNNNISQAFQGLNIDKSSSSIISGNTINNCSYAGIHLSESENNELLENEIYDNEDGIILRDSTRTIISSNLINNNSNYGIYLLSSSDNTIRQNTIYDNQIGIRVTRISADSASASDNIVSQNQITNNKEQGILIADSHNSVTRNEISNNLDGIALSFSGENKVSSNNIENNGRSGIHVYTDANEISSNTLTNNSEFGIALGNANNNTIKFNAFVQNNNGSTQASEDAGPNNNFTHNYWSDHLSPDNDNDNIVDIPYNISISSHQDTSPLTMKHALTKPVISAPSGGIHELSIDIHWEEAIDNYANTVSYDVAYSTNEGLTWAQITSELDETTHHWEITRLSNGSNYLLSIIAESEGLIIESISIPFTIRHFTPSAPLNLVAENLEGTIELKWDFPESLGSTTFEKFLIYRGKDLLSMNYMATTTEPYYFDTATRIDESYYYYVVAVNSIGMGPPSNVASISTSEIDTPDVGLGVRVRSAIIIGAVAIIISGVIIGITKWKRWRIDKKDHKNNNQDE